MKIDATRYTMFWQNPERYRLREIWKIQPVEAKIGTADRKRKFGLYRGICFHEMIDGLHTSVSIEDTSTKLLQRGYGNDEVEGAALLAAGVRDLGSSDKCLAHEAVFEAPIPGTAHILTGRIDSICERDGEILIFDWKTSRYRSKSQLAQKGEEYCRSAQVSFYLLGATVLGFEPRGFIYCLVTSRDEGVAVNEYRTERTARELKTFERGVALTCDLIEYLKEKHNPQVSWPILQERYPTGFESRLGLPMYPNWVPDGFETKREHLSVMEGK